MLTVVHAYDRIPFAEIICDDLHSINAKLDAATKVFANRKNWLAPYQRMDILRRLAALMEQHKDHLSLQIAKEGGKPLIDAIVEVNRAIDGVRNAVEELRTFTGHTVPMGTTPASAGRWAFTIREPIGIVAALSAFNHPLNLIVHQVVPAIAVGCPVLVKPAPATPLSCRDFINLVYEAGLPEPWCQIVITDQNVLAEFLATDPRIAFMSFIGSARVGWYLRNRLPPGTRCALEHGGAAPAIIDQTADLDAAIPAIAKGGYYHAGQVCVSTQRIWVHASIIEDFTTRFTERVAGMRVGDPTHPDVEIGPLIHPREVERVLSWVQSAIGDGAQAILPCRKLTDTTLSPSILIEPPKNAMVSNQEIFGPVTCVYGYSDMDKAIEAANALPFAFQASVFSQHIDRAISAAERLDASAVMINDHTAFRTDWMPFAGRRQSGYGTGGIPATMRDMTQEKLVVLRR